MKTLVVGFIALTALGLTTIAYCDGIIIPVSIKVESFKKEMKSIGIDLYGRDDSDGEIQNLGTSIKVITYKPVTLQQLDLIRQMAVRSMRKNG